jgi:hypothetical protein
MVNTVSLHAFVDESRRKSTYLVAAAIVDPGDLVRLRKLLLSLLLPGQKELHFKKETPGRRKLIMSRLCAAEVDVRIYRRSCVYGDEAARQDCLAALTRDLLEIGVMRLVLDTREERDIHDAQTIRNALGAHPKETLMTYEHTYSHSERLLWIADAAVWCYGAGGDWQRRAGGVIRTVSDLDTWA